eukprot:6185874-Pleurochrysis_carterae.AAC.1
MLVSVVVGRAYFHWNLVTTFASALGNQLTAMQGDASQRAVDSSAVLGFVLCNQILFYRQRNPTPFSVPTAVEPPGASAYTCSSAVRQPRARPWSAMSRKSNSSGSTNPV